MINLFSSFVPNAMAIDLGTVNTLVAVRGYGVVVNEASAIAVSSREETDVLAVGNNALDVCGRTPGGALLKFPFRRGVIADFSLAEFMIKFFMEKALKQCSRDFSLIGPRVLLCVPGCITEVEKRALEEAAKRAGARDVLVMEEALAACIGVGLPYREATASMIVDIGGGTTDVAVIVLGGIAAQKSIRVGGNNMDEEIIAHVRKKHNMVIGARTAERIKLDLGACGESATANMPIRGLSMDTNLPAGTSVTAKEIHSALKYSVECIVSAVREVLSITPPELAGDIMKNGIVLTGGGAKLPGLAEAIQKAVCIETRISGNTLESVALGALKVLESLQRRKDIMTFREYPSLVN